MGSRLWYGDSPLPIVREGSLDIWITSGYDVLSLGISDPDGPILLLGDLQTVEACDAEIQKPSRCGDV